MKYTIKLMNIIYVFFFFFFKEQFSIKILPILKRGRYAQIRFSSINKNCRNIVYVANKWIFEINSCLIYNIKIIIIAFECGFANSSLWYDIFFGKFENFFFANIRKCFWIKLGLLIFAKKAIKNLFRIVFGFLVACITRSC